MNAFLRALSLVTCLIPERWVAPAAKCLGFLIFRCFRYRQSVIRDNLCRAFGPQGVLALEPEVHQHLAQTIIEFLRIPRYARGGYSDVRLDGVEHLRAAEAQGRGVLILTGHLGSFELAAGAAAFRLAPSSFTLVVKSLPAAVERFVTGIRKLSGLKPVQAMGAMKAILRGLRSQENVVFVHDQHALPSLGVVVDFFGHRASTMSGLATVARRTGAPVVGVSIWREGRGHVLRFHPAIVMPELPKVEAIAAATQAYNDFLESQIRLHPSQWLWSHRRFKVAASE